MLQLKAVKGHETEMESLILIQPADILFHGFLALIQKELHDQASVIGEHPLDKGDVLHPS